MSLVNFHNRRPEIPARSQDTCLLINCEESINLQKLITYLSPERSCFSLQLRKHFKGKNKLQKLHSRHWSKKVTQNPKEFPCSGGCRHAVPFEKLQVLARIT